MAARRTAEELAQWGYLQPIAPALTPGSHLESGLAGNAVIHGWEYACQPGTPGREGGPG